MLDCLVGLLIFTLVVVVVLYVGDVCLKAVGFAAPSVVRTLVGLLAGLLILIRALQCLPVSVGHVRLWG